MYLVYGLSAIPAGFLADRFGSRRMLIVAAAGCGLSLVLIAAAPSFPLLSVGLVGAGDVRGGLPPERTVAAVAGGGLRRAGPGHRHPRRRAGTWARPSRRPGPPPSPPPCTGGPASRWGPCSPSPARCWPPPCRLARLAARPPTATGPPGDPSQAAPAGPCWAPPWSGSPATAPCAGCCCRWWRRGSPTAGSSPSCPFTCRRDTGSGAAASYVMSAVLLAGHDRPALRGRAGRPARSRERLYLVLTALGLPLLVALALTSAGAAIVAALGFGFVWALAQPVANALTADLRPGHRPRAAVRHPVRGHLRGRDRSPPPSAASCSRGAAPGWRSSGLAGATALGIAATFALLRAARPTPARSPAG